MPNMAEPNTPSLTKAARINVLDSFEICRKPFGTLLVTVCKLVGELLEIGRRLIGYVFEHFVET